MTSPSRCAGHAPLESDQEPSSLCPGRNPGSTLQLRHQPMTQLDYTARRAIECNRYVAAIPRRLVIPLASTMPRSVRAPARGGIVLKTVHANGRSAGALWHPAASSASACRSRAISHIRLTFAAAIAIRADNRRSSILISIRDRPFQGDVQSSNFHRTEQPRRTTKDSKGGFNLSTVHFPRIPPAVSLDKIRARTPHTLVRSAEATARERRQRREGGGGRERRDK
jgi:hypothetical protein